LIEDATAAAVTHEVWMLRTAEVVHHAARPHRALQRKGMRRMGWHAAGDVQASPQQASVQPTADPEATEARVERALIAAHGLVRLVLAHTVGRRRPGRIGESAAVDWRRRRAHRPRAE